MDADTGLCLGCARTGDEIAIWRTEDDCATLVLVAIRKRGYPAVAQVMGALGREILADSPTRVIESALGRIEVSALIPMPDDTSPPGSHTHLLPDHLATNRALPAGFDLHRAYLPGVILYFALT